VTDIELDDLFDFGNRCDVAIMESMACIDDEADIVAIMGSARDALELLFLLFAPGIRVTARMQFDDGRTGSNCRIELCRLGIDKQRCTDTGFRKLAACVTHFVQLPGNIQTAFCCQLLAILGYQANIGWFRRNRDIQHFLRYSTLEVHVRAHDLSYLDEVAVLNMPPVFAKMYRNAIRTGLLHECDSFRRTRVPCSARLTQRRDVVDVDTEIQWVGGHGVLF
jgi:hypothetical protein